MEYLKEGDLTKHIGTQLETKGLPQIKRQLNQRIQEAG